VCPAVWAAAALLLAGNTAQSQTTWLDATSGTNTITTNFTSGSAGLTLNMGFYTDYLIVGGGGGGGATVGGGGGGGGMATGSTIVSATNYPIAVGGGGGGGALGNTGSTGGTSSALSFSASGGVGGRGSSNARAGGNSGSPQARTGGTGWVATSGDGAAGGGGAGAGANGSNGSTSSLGGAGGSGTTSTITGSSVFYAGGGGGGNEYVNGGAAGAGGSGGGGNGGQGFNDSRKNGANGTFFGGGGGGGGAFSGPGGAGAGGVVILRYSGSTVGNVGGTVTTGSGSAGGTTLHTFNTSGSFNFNLSSLNLNDRLGATLTGTISGTGGLTYNGPGTLTLSASNTYTGPTTVASGTLRFGGSNRLASGNAIAVSGGSLNLNGFSQTAGQVTLTSGTIAGGSLSGTSFVVSDGLVSTALSGAGMLSKSGVGTVTLAAAASHSGGTRVTQGTLALGAGGSLPTTGAVEVSGGTLDLGGSTATVGAVTLSSGTIGGGTLQPTSIGVERGTVSAVLTGTGKLTKSTAGTLLLSGSNTSWTGGAVVNGGTLALPTAASLGSGALSVGDSAVEFGARFTAANAITLTGAASSTTLTVGQVNVDYLVVGGGGGGGAVQASGGGGGGGVQSGAITLTGSSYGVAVGVGGAAGTSGGSSVAFGVTATGGIAGASLGGNGGASGSPQLLTGGTGWVQGGGQDGLAGGGGAGAGVRGNNGGTNSVGGNGGAGLTSTITGSSVFYAGGGGGGSEYTGSGATLSGTGGAGGGGNGGLGVSSSAKNGGAATFYGGGGGGGGAYNGPGGSGYRGVVIVRYAGAPLASGGSITSGTGTAAGYTIHTFDSAGSSQFTIDGTIAGPTLSGAISGTGGFTWDSDSTLTLGGTNTYSGGTIVARGAVVGTTDSLQGAITNNATVQFAQSTTGTYAGVMDGSGAVVKTGVGTLTLTANNTYSGLTTISAGRLVGSTVSLPGAIANAAELEFAQTSAGTFASAISGSGSVTKSGVGTLTLTAANTFSGATAIASGTLRIGDGGTTGSLGAGGVAVAAGAALTFDRSDTVSVANSISGDGVIVKSGVGDLTLTGANSYTGGTVIHAGTLIASSNTALGTGAVTLSGGELEFGTGVALANQIVLTAAPAAATFTSPFNVEYLVVGGGGGGGSIQASGGGGGGGVATGATLLTDTSYSIVVGAGGAGGTSGGGSSALGVSVGGGTAGGSNGGNGGASGSPQSLAGGTGWVQGGGQDGLAGGGGAGAGASGSNGGTNSVGGNGGGGVASAISGASIFYAGGGGGGSEYTGSGATLAGVGGAGGGGNGGLGVNTSAKNGGNATFFGGGGGGGGAFGGPGGSGAGGVVVIRYAGDPVASGGTITSGTNLAAGYTLHTFSSAGTGLFLIDGAVAGPTLSGVLTGTGGFTWDSSLTLTLTGSNTYGGGTVISAGAVRIGNGGGTGSLGTGDITNNAALIVDRSNAYTIPGAISGTGSLTKSGAGNLILAGTSTFTGPTTISTGRLSVNGALGNTAVSVATGAELGGSGSIVGALAILSGGTLAPGNSIASLSGGATSFAAGSTFGYEVDSSLLGSLGVAADLLVVSGNLDIASGSLLTFTDLASSPQPFVNNTSFALINYSGSWNGGLFSYGGTPLADGGQFFVGSQQWQIDYNSPTGGSNYTSDYLPSSSFVTVMAVPEPGAFALAAAGCTAVATLAIRRRISRRGPYGP
jgi:autotransporter-associated beta strand protein